jgi:hypothetical protein
MRRENEPPSKAVMLLTLETAVPLWIERWKRRSPKERDARADHCAQVIGEKGDVLQYGGKGCAEAFNALAESLALLSFAPGGVRFCDLHWETKP